MIVVQIVKERRLQALDNSSFPGFTRTSSKMDESLAFWSSPRVVFQQKSATQQDVFQATTYQQEQTWTSIADCEA